jgi:hypothetical protein
VIFRLGNIEPSPRGCGDVHLVLQHGIRASCDIAVVGEKSPYHSQSHQAAACARQIETKEILGFHKVVIFERQ